MFLARLVIVKCETETHAPEQYWQLKKISEAVKGVLKCEVDVGGSHYTN